MGYLEELSAKNPVYLVCLIGQQLDEIFCGPQAGENSIEPGCKDMLAQAAVPTIDFSGQVAKTSDRCQLSPTQRSMLNWSRDFREVAEDGI